MASRRKKTHRWNVNGELRVLNEPPKNGTSEDALATHFVLGRARPATTKGFAMTAGDMSSGLRRHRDAQLLYIVRGEVTCQADGAWWVVPPGSALWVPGDVDHRVVGRAPLEGYVVFLSPHVAKRMSKECGSVSVTPLLREVVLRLGKHPVVYDRRGAAARLVAVLLDELSHASVDNHRLPMPRDVRLQKLVAMITENPAEKVDLTTWSKRIGVAERTLSRILVQETGLSFGRWRQQLHVVLAIQSMARGQSVKNVAGELGYESASSFVTMFRKALGMSPAKYMAERGARRTAPSSARRRGSPPVAER